jgi:replicative DNA helicase
LASTLIRGIEKNPNGVTSAIEEHHKNLLKLEKRFAPSDKVSISDVLSGKKSRQGEKSFIEKLKNRKAYYAEYGKPFINGIPLGYIDFDDKATVLSPINFIVLAGRPSMGKTAFALNISANVCFNQNKPIGFYFS